MEVLLANVDNVKFEIETQLEEQYGILPLPFAGMDSKYNIMFDQHGLCFNFNKLNSNKC